MLIDTLFEKVVALSKYVGREQKDEKGQSMFERLLVQDRDKPLIVQYMTEAATDLDKALHAFGTLGITATEIGWTWNSEEYDMPAIMDNLLELYLVDAAMSAWCQDKVAERAEYFGKVAAQLAVGIPKTIFRTKPA